VQLVDAAGARAADIGRPQLAGGGSAVDRHLQLQSSSLLSTAARPSARSAAYDMRPA